MPAACRDSWAKESNPSRSSVNAKSLTARPPGNALFLILIKKCVYVEIRVCVAGQGPGIAALWVSTTSFGLAYHWVCPGWAPPPEIYQRVRSGWAWANGAAFHLGSTHPASRRWGQGWPSAQSHLQSQDGWYRLSISPKLGSFCPEPLCASLALPVNVGDLSLKQGLAEHWGGHTAFWASREG